MVMVRVTLCGRMRVLAGSLLLLLAKMLHDDNNGQEGEAHGSLLPLPVEVVPHNSLRCAHH